MSISSPTLSKRTQRRLALMKHNNAVDQQTAVAANRAIMEFTVASAQGLGVFMIAWYLLETAVTTF